MTSDLAHALVRAAGDHDRPGFGRALESVLGRGPATTTAVAECLVADLAEAMRGVVTDSGSPDGPLQAISMAVGGAHEAICGLLGVNRVVLEHLARATVGLSDYLDRLDPALVAMYASLLLGTVRSPGGDDAYAPPPVPAPPVPASAEPATDAAGDSTDAVRELVTSAIVAAAGGDAADWRRQAGEALAIDADAADRAARAELRSRLDRQELPDDLRLDAVVAGAAALASATTDGPFACSAEVVELVVRRALDEPGCVDHVDLGEMTYAATEVAAMLDIYDWILPPGWGYAVHGVLD